MLILKSSCIVAATNVLCLRCFFFLPFSPHIYVVLAYVLTVLSRVLSADGGHRRGSPRHVEGVDRAGAAGPLGGVGGALQRERPQVQAQEADVPTALAHREVAAALARPVEGCREAGVAHVGAVSGDGGATGGQGEDAADSEAEAHRDGIMTGRD